MLRTLPAVGRKTITVYHTTSWTVVGVAVVVMVVAACMMRIVECRRADVGVLCDKPIEQAVDSLQDFIEEPCCKCSIAVTQARIVEHSLEDDLGVSRMAEMMERHREQTANVDRMPN